MAVISKGTKQVNQQKPCTGSNFLLVVLFNRIDKIRSRRTCLNVHIFISKAVAIKSIEDVYYKLQILQRRIRKCPCEIQGKTFGVIT